MSAATWREQGACRGLDPALFFPERGDSTAAAKATCASCPVRAQCLDYGLYERFGIWGGKGERERRRIRHERQERKGVAA